MQLKMLKSSTASDHCLVRVRMLHYFRVGSRITITQSHMHTMQQTHTHKVVTGCVEAKQLLSRQRQSEYNDWEEVPPPESFYIGSSSPDADGGTLGAKS